MDKQTGTDMLGLIRQLRELTDRAKEERDALLTLVSRLESENAQLRRENAEWRDMNERQVKQ